MLSFILFSRVLIFTRHSLRAGDAESAISSSEIMQRRISEEREGSGSSREHLSLSTESSGRAVFLYSASFPAFSRRVAINRSSFVPRLAPVFRRVNISASGLPSAISSSSGMPVMEKTGG